MYIGTHGTHIYNFFLFILINFEICLTCDRFLILRIFVENVKNVLCRIYSVVIIILVIIRYRSYVVTWVGGITHYISFSKSHYYF